MKLCGLYIFLLLPLASCINSIDLGVGKADIDEVVIDGYISDEPGPYSVRLSKAFDIQSKLSFKEDISASRIVIFDDHGNQEELVEKRQGLYQTDPSGIRGVLGHVYTLRVELRDGRIYESIPDTLKSTGKVDSIYYEYQRVLLDSVLKPVLKVSFDATTGKEGEDHFLWKFVGTYKVDTNPELYDTLCVESRCPKPLPCSGYVLNSTGDGILQRRPCQCCTCWVNFFNDEPIVSDIIVPSQGKFENVGAAIIPINQWTFMYRVHVEIRQLSLSSNAFQFWKTVRAQKEAVLSLFQPVIGKVPVTFVQVGGAPGSVAGLFYATSVSSKSRYIDLTDIPKFVTIPPVDPLLKDSCLKRFANATTEKPAYWVD